LGEREELRRRYIAQQVELGGAEVVMPGRLEAGGKPARLELVATAAAKWRENAPAIPGPGLTVVTELPAILGDPL